jgi:hypothetical protein
MRNTTTVDAAMVLNYLEATPGRGSSPSSSGSPPELHMATLERWGKTDTDGVAIVGVCPSCPGLRHNAEHIICACALWLDERKTWVG